VTLRTCLTCGEPSAGPRCPQHTLDAKGTATQRGYDAAWDRLSKRARRLQPWCETCGATEGLQADHSPEAWARKAAGKPIRLTDVRVLCGPCNRDAGAARGPSATRGSAPPAASPRPRPRRNLSLTSGGGS
jgi:hypothetical protein